jgi:hypothetical protein
MAVFRLLAMGMVLAPSIGAQSLIKGRVVADSSRSPLAGAELFVAGVRVAGSDSAGDFALSVQPGTTRLNVRRLGFAPLSRTVTLRRGETLSVVLEMTPMPVSLDSITVRGSAMSMPALMDFEARRRIGIGRFLADSALRVHDNGLSFGGLLRRWGIGTYITPQHEHIAVTARGPIRFGFGPCPIQVFLDGVIIGRYDVRHIKVSDLEAIEFYAGAAQTPVIFDKGSAACGVLVLWTRRPLR